MNGVVKWLFMFVFGFIVAFTFMFFVSGSVEQSNDGIIEYVKRPYKNGDEYKNYGITYINNGKTIYGEGTVEGRTYSIYMLTGGVEIKDMTQNVMITAYFEGNYGVDANAFVRFYADLRDENKTYITTVTMPASPKGWVQKELIPEQYLGQIKYMEIALQVINVTGPKYNFHFTAKISATQKIEPTGQNMLTWFTNVVNTTRQQSFWDFVKEPIQRFIDKMSYFDSLEKPSFVEVLTAIWNVFLLILSPIEIIGRALWWLALVLYDLIPLLLNPTWV